MLFFFFLFFFILGFAGEIKIINRTNQMRLINRKNDKIYSYYKLNPNEVLKFRVNHKDSVVIFSRIIIKSKKKTEYSYELIKPKSVKTVTRNSKQSKQTFGMNGEIISSFNKYKFKPAKDRYVYKIVNSSQNELLIKIKDDNTRNLEKLEYTTFSPQEYSSEIVLEISGKEFTYYSGNSQNIEFLLEGPVYLKFVSRLLYDSGNEKQRNYTFSIFDNGTFKTEKTISTYRSRKTKEISGTFKDVSKGDVQILRLEAGKHKIKFSTSDKSLIFRFYISKKSIG